MKRISIIFLQAVIVLIGIAALVVLIWLPLTEGRAADLDLFGIYSDPLILYGYAASAVFFTALYKAFKLLGYIGRDEAFTFGSVGALKSIRHCAVAFSVLIVIGGLFIMLTHNKEDDPAGFLALCMAAVFVSVVVAAAASVFEKILRSGADIKSANVRIQF